MTIHDLNPDQILATSEAILEREKWLRSFVDRLYALGFSRHDPLYKAAIAARDAVFSLHAVVAKEAVKDCPVQRVFGMPPED